MGASESTSSSSLREECFVRNEMMCQPSGEPIPVEKLLTRKKSICLIKVCSGGQCWSGTGFFVKFPCTGTDGNPYIYGIMTNNHVLGAEQLVTGTSFTIVSDSSDSQYTVAITNDLFVFTSDLIDVTFVQLNQNLISRINPFFLTASSCDAKEGDRIVILQHPLGGELSFTQGTIVSMWGSDYLHTASTDYGSSGSPLLDRQFEVVGLHKMRRTDERANVATRISVISYAIREAYSHLRSGNKSKLPARALTQEEVGTLRQHGLVPTDLDCLFVSPSSLFVTQLLFFRTNHAWYWTPLASVRYKIDDLKECNWSIIQPHRKSTAIGGFWDGQEPAPRNINLIEWLASTELSFME